MGPRTTSRIRNVSLLNRKRNFGAALEYIPAMIEDEFGYLSPALFTRDQIMEARQRARNNPEDAPRATWLAELIQKLKGNG